MSQENIETFDRVAAAFQRGDFDVWIESFAEDGVFVPQRAPIQGTYTGEAALRGFLADNEESFDVFQPSYEDVRDLGDRVLALGKLRLRGKEGGVDIEVPSALVLTFRDGKIVRFEDFGDKRRALEAVGLSE